MYPYFSHHVPMIDVAAVAVAVDAAVRIPVDVSLAVQY
jgi:hypothetical protein